MATATFTLMSEFAVTVPADYKHANQLDSFLKKIRKSKNVYGYNENITDANFAKVTTQLVPGKTYKVKIFGINGRVTSADCLVHYRSQKAIFTGAQGASLVWEQKKEEFRKGKWTASFDEKEALWKDTGGYHGVPGVFCDSIGDHNFPFELSAFEFDWYSFNCLLCFCEE